MVMGGDGRRAVTVMWALTIVTFVFVVLRTYTRLVVVKLFGIDDQVYILAFIFLVCYTAFTTLSAKFGLGQHAHDLEPADMARAVLLEVIGLTFAVTGMVIAKWSLGIFLLRLVMETAHKWAIWTAMLSLLAASISTCFVFWFQCTPPPYLWDRRIDGECHVDSTPVTMTLCVICVIVDFFFALFPWLFIWKLNMNTREKLVILLSMSLGVIAGACGIKRTMEVPELAARNYLNDTISLVVWSAAEIAVTMICIGIPVCRPLYRRFLTQLSSNDGSKYKKRRNEGRDMFALHTYGGSTMKPVDNGTLESSAGKGLGDEDLTKHAIRGDFNRPYISAGPAALDNNTSEESILRRSSAAGNTMSQHGILVIEEYAVTRQPRS
ncbi:hypothetical protein PG990_007160 [Apiospora arundinis]